MQIEGVPFAVTDFQNVPETRHAGEAGYALWRTIEIGNLRVRIVEYSPGYLADHWCRRGHVLYVLRGVLVTELEDGRSFTLTTGMSYQVSNADNGHRSATKVGCQVFIVD